MGGDLTESNADRILAYLRAMPTGATCAALVNVLGIKRERIATCCGNLIARGTVAYVGGARGRVYYAVEHAPDHAKRETMKRKPKPPDAPSITISHRRLPAAVGEAIVPPGVKVTICPAGLDQRFTFHPPKGWRGQITRDWMERKHAR
jgi:hypothetical protein